jgi:hypothetical protein
MKTARQRESDGRQRRMSRGTSTELAQLKSVAEQVTLEMKPNELNELGKFGGPPETRTPDPLIKSQLLYQLS